MSPSEPSRSEQMETGDSKTKTPSNVSLKDTFGLREYRFTRGKVIGLALAACFLVMGLLLRGDGSSTEMDVSGGADSSAVSTGSGSGGLSIANSLVQSDSGMPKSGSETPSRSSGSQGDEQSGGGTGSIRTEDFSAFFAKGGFGFFVGFAIGFAIRAFVRLAVVMAGVYFIALAWMSYAGWVEIHWDAMGKDFDQIVGNLEAQLTSLKAFITGAIPASGMTAAGLALGLKRG